LRVRGRFGRRSERNQMPTCAAFDFVRGIGDGVADNLAAFGTDDGAQHRLFLHIEALFTANSSAVVSCPSPGPGLSRRYNQSASSSVFSICTISCSKQANQKPTQQGASAATISVSSLSGAEVSCSTHARSRKVTPRNAHTLTVSC